MKSLFMRLTLVAISLLAFSLPGFAGQLDDYYLSAFGENPGSALEKAVLLQSAATTGAPQCGTPLKHSLRRDWDQLEPATQKVLAKQLAAPTLSGPEQTLLSTSGRYLIHYTTSGSDALIPAGGFTVQTWVQTVAQTFDDVAAAYLARGWRLAPTVGGAPYDIYLRNLAPAGLYGQTTSTSSVPSPGFANAYASFLEVDKDMTAANLTVSGTYSPLNLLQITAAHEYHHAIQYGYNIFFDTWYAEATSTWNEDELYDSVNQNYNYLPAWFNNSTRSLDIAVRSDATTIGAGYSRWIFNRFLDEKHGSTVVRSAWEKLATLNSSGGNADIPMTPVLEGVLSAAPFSSSLGADFFGLAKRFYTRDWATHIAEVGLIHPYVPVVTYTSYPVTSSSTPAPSVTLPHYSFAFYKFTPSAGAPVNLTVTINATSGIGFTVFKKVTGVISEVAPNAGGLSFTVNPFNTTDEVVLLIANTVNVDGHQAAFSTSGAAAAVTEPPSTPASTLTPASSGGGGGGGCFIATAAYGSYLHPQVQVLRDFRDHYLLTNAPGRAFVALYYRLSPPLADFIARHGTLRLLVRLLLTPVVLGVKYPVALGGMLVIAPWGIMLMVRRRKSLFSSAH